MTDLTGPLPPPPGTELYTTEDIAEKLSVTPGAVRQMHRRGTAPPSIKAGRRRLYPSHLFEHWIRDRT